MLDLTQILARDVDEALLDELAHVCPRAYGAVVERLIAVEHGRLHPASSDFDMPLSLLIEEDEERRRQALIRIRQRRMRG